ncbi:hypothetical protein B0H63DRAFT_182142 [Podospora didyma]|uniref:Uncharacterized protein n=1 Tax=Podospora didyma TaxID=330526 RepID=A0AAE0NPM4_9PEZI|nr:hypothetical protein B0H63DRAFT_182142 [Podospora didyma]
MGKPSDPLAPRPSDDAMSLHSQSGSHLGFAPGFVDDDAPELQVDDLPPLYEDSVDVGSSSSAPLLPHTTPLGMISTHKEDANTGAKFYLDSRLDTNPKFLEEHIRWWAETPPRAYVKLLGTHTQTVDNNGKKEKKTVTDFEVLVELTPYLFSDPTYLSSWRELRTVENSEKARRGTVLRKRAPGAKQNIELGLADKPTLPEWCHRFCASAAGLKCLTLQRRVVGFDEEKVRQKLEALVRGTNYRGHLAISFPLKDARIDVYNDCKTNAWRLTAWIWWLCILTLMFIFTWPYLYFRTKRFEVIYADWHYSRIAANGRREFVSIDEDRWYNMWGRAISNAVLEQRQCTLNQQDLINSQGAAVPVASGNTIVDGALSFVRAGVTAMNEVNRHLGWGHDS